MFSVKINLFVCVDIDVDFHLIFARFLSQSKQVAVLKSKPCYYLHKSNGNYNYTGIIGTRMIPWQGSCVGFPKEANHQDGLQTDYKGSNKIINNIHAMNIFCGWLNQPEDQSRVEASVAFHHENAATFIRGHRLWSCQLSNIQCFLSLFSFIILPTVLPSSSCLTVL